MNYMPQSSVAAYLRLNEAVRDVFFDGRYQQRPVYLEIADDRVEELASKLKVSEDELEEYIGLVVAESFGHGHADPYAWHLQETKKWARDHEPDEAPPYLGVLALLSLAAERMRDDGEFSSNNYYTRLIEILRAEGTSLANRVKTHARSTRSFWRSLNQWLSENDFELGRPTAMQVNSWAYVSYALSQALVRDADRQRFHSLFRENDLSPLDEVSVSEMLLLLHDWMAGSGPNAWLKKLWSTTDLRERIASSALLELGSWDGAEGTSGPRARQLAWTASIGGFPRRKVGLFLTTVGVAADGELDLVPPTSPGEAFAAATIECRDDLALVTSPTGDFSVLEPASRMNVSALLLASVELETKSGDKYCHAPRPIVPLARPEGSIYYREVQRASLLRRHIVLCHGQWLSKVTAHLQACARPGFKVKTSADLPGLPGDWRLIEDVELVRVIEDAHQNLAALVPLSEGVAVQFEGGFRLAPQIYHTQVPPGILATSDHGDFDLVVRCQAIDAPDQVLFTQRSRGGSCVVDAEAFDEFEASEVTVVAKMGSREASEKALAFRDSSIPRPLRKYETVYDLESACLAGKDCSIDMPESAIEGMIIYGTAPEVAAGSPPQLQHAAAVVADESAPRQHDEPVGGLRETCVIRGYHFWRCEPANWNDPSWEAKRMDCKDCRMSVVLRDRGKRRRGGPLIRTGRKSRPVEAPPVEPLGGRVSAEMLLDGLSYLGEGTWHSFQNVVAAHNDEPWAASSFARDLRDLGHIDFRCDKHGRPSHWRVASPALVFASEDECFLAGFRSRGLIDEIGDALEELDAEYVLPSDDGFPRIGWKGVTLDWASEVLAEIRDPHGRPLEVVSSPAMAIASAAWPSSKIFAAAPSIYVDTLKDLEFFHAAEGRWREATTLREVGAYRTKFAGTRYFFRDQEGETRAVSPGLAKVLAARAAGVSLHHYDASSGTLIGQLGCDLPGLLGRAAVACSGSLPRQDGPVLHFEDVPRDVAEKIIAKVYG